MPVVKKALASAIRGFLSDRVPATGVLVLRDWQNKLVPTLLTNIAIIAVALVIASRAKRPISGRQENLPPVELVTGSTGGP